MKNNRIDEIFRGKIGELEKAPPEGSWNKINNGLQGKWKVARWMALKAAGIALVCIAAAYLVHYTTADQKRNNIPVAEHPFGSSITGFPENQPLPEKPLPPQTAGVQDKKPYPDKEHRQIAVREKKSLKTKTVKKKVGKEETEQAAGAERPGAAEPERTVADPGNPEQLASVTPAAGSVQPGTPERETGGKEGQTEDRKPVITIIYKSGTNSKPALAAESPGTEPEPSALEKIVGTARDIREGELSLAELREAKDALFALNFKSQEE